MDFSLSSDQILIRDTVRQFMETEMRPVLREYERAEKFPAEQLKKLGELGCCGMLVPEEWGGSGTDTVSYALMLEEVARVDASTAVALSVTNSVVAVPLCKSGSEPQKKKYLSRLSRGEILGAFCLTEPQAGSDASGIQTRAAREGDHYILNGTKAWVTNGGVSGLYIVFAKTDPAAGSRGVTAFLVEPDFPGFRISRYEDKMGLRLSRSAEISLQDCRVPVENRLGEEGQGLRIALESLDGGRIGIAAQSVGVGQGALEAATRYAKQRKTFGRPIADYQAIQWMLADMETEVSAARVLTHYAAWQRDKDLQDRDSHEKDLRGREVANAQAGDKQASRAEGRDAAARRRGSSAPRAKLYASEMANRVAYKAVQVHGSSGYSRETDVERYYRDARVLTIYEGTSEMQRLVIARDLLRH
jgi:alkylation response protein AidB-like acyl-CoA dehydrogenase